MDAAPLLLSIEGQRVLSSVCVVASALLSRLVDNWTHQLTASDLSEKSMAPLQLQYVFELHRADFKDGLCPAARTFERLLV